MNHKSMRNLYLKTRVREWIQSPHTNIPKVAMSRRAMTLIGRGGTFYMGDPVVLERERDVRAGTGRESKEYARAGRGHPHREPRRNIDPHTHMEIGYVCETALAWECG
jgi:hypothetical protein